MDKQLLILIGACVIIYIFKRMYDTSKTYTRSSNMSIKRGNVDRKENER